MNHLSLTLKEVKEKYVFNKRREDLYNQLLDEINYTLEFTSDLKIAIFGSFITNKKYPNDIDIIVRGVLNEHGFKLKIIQLRQPIPVKNPNVQRKGNFILDKTCGEINKSIEEFNQNVENKEKGICIKDFIELNDIQNFYPHTNKEIVKSS